MPASVPNRRRQALCTACCLAAAFSAHAQSTAVPGSPRWFFESVTVEPPSDLEPRARALYTQMLPAVGREDLLAALPGRVTRTATCDSYSGAAGSPVEHLAELATATSIVIINEAHDEPRHREIIRQLAIALRQDGFAYFAAETFGSSVNEHPDEKFGRTDAGFYSNEPAFGNLLRSVKELGYTLVAYEHSPAAAAATPDPTGGIVEREEGQAENLVARIFRADPRAKALIHVGHSHAAEAPLEAGGQIIPWMAARLKAKTGVDPLTIDQTYCASRTDAVELAASSTERAPAGAFDIAIAHPAPTFFRGRPQWRIDAGAIAVELPPRLVSAQRSIVEARYADEPPDAIPLDRLLLRPEENLPLLLPLGRVRLLQVFEDESEPRSLTLNVQ